MCLSWGLPLGEKGDVPGHSTALYRAPAPDLTGPVGSVEHHTLTRFYALKTQNELQGLKSPGVVRRVWGMGLMAGKRVHRRAQQGLPRGLHSIPSPPLVPAEVPEDQAHSYHGCMFLSPLQGSPCHPSN